MLIGKYIFVIFLCSFVMKMLEVHAHLPKC